MIEKVLDYSEKNSDFSFKWEMGLLIITEPNHSIHSFILKTSDLLRCTYNL